MDVFLARQPILDVEQKVYAYEILYRNNNKNSFDNSEPDTASNKVIFDIFQTFGIENLTNSKPVFVNFTDNLIKDSTATLLPNDLLVVEILETVTPDQEIIKRCVELKEKGYTLALDDFVYRDDYKPLIELADIIKVDFLESTKSEIEYIVKTLKNKNITLLAEKVETREQFNYAKDLGFELFQGFFFSKPEIVKTKTLSPLRTNYLHLVTKVNEDEIDFQDIANIISRDISLTYNLLKLVNSQTFGFSNRIYSVKHAVVILGEKGIRKWLPLVVVRDLGDGAPDEVMKLSLIRARFGELLCKKTIMFRHSEDVFLVGLFSLIDVLLSRPTSEILDEIKASSDIVNCLIHNKGILYPIYDIVISYEKGQWEELSHKLEHLRITPQDITDAYINALIWYNKLTRDQL